MLYKKVDTSLNFVEREDETEKFWKENKIFEKSVENRAGAKNFTFYDGPPTANGKPHAGHILTRAIKDLIPRYKTMKGYCVERKAGWDTHGLPVEIEVEKLLGINGKEQIEKYGIEPFIQQCKESVWKYKGIWEDFSDKVAYWIDTEHPYITYDNNYIESVWWSLKEIDKKGLLYRGYKIVPYCSRCGTPLSSHEVAQGYIDLKEESIYVKFRIKGKKSDYILAWTTTPWTLPSNVALCVNPKETYVKIEKDGETFILAEALVEKHFGEAKVIEKYKGSDLEGTEYEPLFDFVVPDKKAYYVVCADFVTLTDGTGIVHIAPAFGEDDYMVGRKYDLPFINLVKPDGTFTEDVKESWTKKFVKELDKDIIKELSEKGLVLKKELYEHSYPHCWRCKTPLLYYAKDSWFIEMSKMREKLVKNNDKIKWFPETIGEKRFGNWLENALDWCLSRDRYWGTPLPVWECECGHHHVIGSIEELKKMSKDCPAEIELHKPYVDQVHIRCEKCGHEMTRVKSTIDVWYDSGAMPFAQLHYPFENKEEFKNKFPADFISEGLDQTRGWFYTLLAISTLLFDEPAYKNVIVLGLVLDADGEKMSKSKGNAVDPMEALKKNGADAIRWYFYVNSAPWLPSRFSDESIAEYQRKFMGTLWNTYAFYILYANIDHFDPTQYKLEYDKLEVMDKWILSRLHTLIKEVDENMTNYMVPESGRAMEKFVDDLSNWYVRRGRERYWARGMEQDKVNAYITLYTVLSEFIKVAAPFIPFMTEQIYQNVVRAVDQSAPLSVHLTDFPVSSEKWVDKELEKNMNNVLRIVTLGRACRNDANIKSRQPLQKLYLKMTDEIPENYLEIVREELNVKEVVMTGEMSNMTSYSFKPQLKTVGPKYGKLVGDIRAALEKLDGNKAYKQLKEEGEIILELRSEKVELAEEDLLIEIKQVEGFNSNEDKDMVVVLDTHLTPELIEEGYIRELISKIQTTRKEAGFDVEDYINLCFEATDTLTKIIDQNVEMIRDSVLAKEMKKLEKGAFQKEWDVNGEKVTIFVERCK